MKQYRITCISDTHNMHKKITNDLPGGDILIHAGDVSSIGRMSEIKSFIKWFSSLPYKLKVFIAGNHDLNFHSEQLFRMNSSYYDRAIYDDAGAIGKPQWLEELLSSLPADVVYLETQSYEWDGIKIWGSPYSPTYGMDWAFNADRGHDINQIWSQIPNDTDIVITHSPMYGYNDRASNTNQNVGCADLYHRLKEVQPHLHVCGHIHEAVGWKTIGLANWYALHTFNACSCNLRYECINRPITFDYNFETGELEFM